MELWEKPGLLAFVKYFFRIVVVLFEKVKTWKQYRDLQL